MTIKVINAGNFIVCGREIKIVTKQNNNKKFPNILFCPKETTYYNAFDCPYCGCQNIVGVVEKGKVESEKTTIIEAESEE